MHIVQCMWIRLFDRHSERSFTRIGATLLGYELLFPSAFTWLTTSSQGLTRPVAVIPVWKHSSPQSTLYCYTTCSTHYSTLHRLQSSTLLLQYSAVFSLYYTVRYVRCSMQQDINGHIDYCVGFNVQWGRRSQRIERTGPWLLSIGRNFPAGSIGHFAQPLLFMQHCSHLEIWNRESSVCTVSYTLYSRGTSRVPLTVQYTVQCIVQSSKP